MWKLINPLQNYCWGSKTALTEIFGIKNPDGLPVAELWMGAHPAAPSRVLIGDREKSLAELIDSDRPAMLGPEVAARFGRLPFLFKVLCADSALSVQVHPDKGAAEQGFARENLAGISLSDPQRNYKDDNHKPELLYALTPFRAMNGFRELPEITALLMPLVGAHTQIASFTVNPSTEALQQLFVTLLSLQGEELSHALALLDEVSGYQQGVAWQTVQELRQQYPDDAGRFMPLLLNVTELKPGEAMFLHARTPHAYFKGCGLEVMANSDNVLRAGLTCKHIDIPELVANVDFVSRPAGSLRTVAVHSLHEFSFPVPVSDFSFAVHRLQAAPQPVNRQGPLIILCLEGTAVCHAGEDSLTLKRGESAFISYAEQPLLLSGEGQVAAAYTSLA